MIVLGRKKQNRNESDTDPALEKLLLQSCQHTPSTRDDGLTKIATGILPAPDMVNSKRKYNAEATDCRRANLSTTLMKNRLVTGQQFKKPALLYNNMIWIRGNITRTAVKKKFA